MTIKAACLIPCTRPNDVDKAIQSAIKFGWDPIILEDINKEGPSSTRNKLFDIAVDRNYDIVRYCDDDDLIIGIYPDDKNIELNSINYFNWISRKNPNVIHKLSFANSYSSLLRSHPWTWIASTENLLNIKNQFGSLWNETYKCQEGGYLWLQFIKLKLKLKHIDIKGYEWFESNNGMHLYESKMSEIENLKTQFILWKNNDV